MEAACHRNPFFDCKFVLLFWTIFDYPSLETDDDGNVYCESNLDILYYVLIIVYKGFVGGVSIVLALLCRNFPGAFSDAKSIGIAIYNECLIAVIAIPIVLSLGSTSFFQWLLEVIAIMFFFLSTFGILMIPKLYGLLVIDAVLTSSTGSNGRLMQALKSSSNSTK
eukprot:TRINITY_DN1001_c0_g1_i4.p1 TRINITY_DN1001_c0_g1~~TRINITY_DN1001_c0_g1_i4.p1  ORF type:complete len:166 (-),score=19.57 TRINITY_DN1001_c0_g1_i4:48-545(-)